ncbi:MAG: hypothetical protein FJ118_05985 [Deltaproteobacteria bacterium]|nr:hypothetical protein [Deltaproteobacteria bacterium]
MSKKSSLKAVEKRGGATGLFTESGLPPQPLDLSKFTALDCARAIVRLDSEQARNSECWGSLNSCEAWYVLRDLADRLWGNGENSMEVESMTGALLRGVIIGAEMCLQRVDPAWADERDHWGASQGEMKRSVDDLLPRKYGEPPPELPN